MSGDSFKRSILTGWIVKILCVIGFISGIVLAFIGAGVGQQNWNGGACTMSFILFAGSGTFLCIVTAIEHGVWD